MRGVNRGAAVQERVPTPSFPDADAVVRAGLDARPEDAVDILLVNPPAPDGGIWIRSQHRVGRRSREGMIWPQVGLAQMAALFPDYRVDVIDAIPHRMTWQTFERLLHVEPQYGPAHLGLARSLFRQVRTERDLDRVLQALDRAKALGADLRTIVRLEIDSAERQERLRRGESLVVPVRGQPRTAPEGDDIWKGSVLDR